MSRWRGPTSSGAGTAVVGVWLMVVLLTIVDVGQLTTQVGRSAPLTVAVGGVLSVVAIGAFLRSYTLLVSGRSGPRVRWLALVQVGSSLGLVVLVSTWPLLALALTSVLLLVAGPRGWLVVVLLCATDLAALLRAADGTSAEAMVLVIAMVVVLGFAMYAMTRLHVVLAELDRTREHLARVRVDEERLRISRDLHDLLGRTLVAVSLRNETALRLLDSDVERCRAQLTALQSSVIDGQAKLRALTSGPTLIGLSDELASARELFGRLGVRAVVDAVEIEDRAVDQALAAVVREAVTNTLKHGRPTTCRIGVRHESLAIVMTVVNDGSLQAAVSSGPHTGLDDVRARVEALGGVITAGPVPGGQFRVIARVPHRPSDPMEADVDLPDDVVVREATAW